jgi:predicted MFS family arabinose efflux permease
VLVAFCALGAWWGAWGALVPEVQRSARVDDGQLGVAVLFVAVGALASMRAAGAVLDRRGDPVLPWLIGVFGAVGVLPAMAHGTAGLSAALAAVGAASGALDVGINAAAAHAEDRTGRPLLSLAHGLFSVGVIASSAVTGLLRRAGAGPLLVLSTAAAALLAAAVLVSAWTGPAGVAARPDRGFDPASSTPWWRPPSRLVLLGVLVALAFLVENVWQTWASVHLERNLGASPLVGSLGPMAFAVAAASGRLAGSRMPPTADRRRLVQAGASLAAAGTLLAATAPALGIGFAGIVLAGAGTSICAPMLFSLTVDGVEPRRRGAATSTATTFGYLGFVVAPALVGGLADLVDLRAALAAATAFAVALALGARAARPARPGEPW